MRGCCLHQSVDEHRVKKRSFAFALAYIKCFRTYSVYLSLRHGVRRDTSLIRGRRKGGNNSQEKRKNPERSTHMDIDYGALFGIDEGGKEQGLAAPAGAEAPREETGQPAGTEMNGRSGTSPQEDAGAQGAKEQEAAEPAGEENQDTDAAVQEEPAAGGDEHSETGKEAKRVQDDARNAEFAAARRKAEAERDAAVEKAKADAQEEARKIIDEAFSRSGLMNPYTKKPITSKAEYDEYKQRYDEERKARVMKKSGMSDEEFEAFVNDLPEVRQARSLPTFVVG